jgi:putative endonuclease
VSAIATGTEHEILAAEYLTKSNLQILHRNFRSKFGEVDIIAHDGRYLIFVEVRYRQHNIYGDAAESVTASKQKKIIRAAQFYLQSRKWAQQLNCRFDVIAISNSIKSPQIEWIKDAFHA